MNQNNGEAPKHNHGGAGIRPRGQCPGCDAYLDQHPEGSPVQRATGAVEEIVAAGPRPYSRTIFQEAATKHHTSYSSVSRLVGVYERRRDLFDRVKTGELSLAEASRQAGFIEYRLGKEHTATGNNIAYGKGDKFWEAIAPISSYLRSWEGRDYEFKHVPHKEAARRLKKLEKILPMLEQAKSDLEKRATFTRLTSPGKYN